MRQRLFQLKEICTKGMAPLSSLNSNFWSLLLNCRTNSAGIEKAPLLADYEAPEPAQRFIISGEVVYLSPTRLYTDAFLTTFLFTAGTRRWSCADFGVFAVLSDGTRTIWKSPGQPFTVVTDPEIPELGLLPQGSAICECNGQAVIAGYPTAGCVSWSKIGSIDFTPGADNEAGYRDIELGTVFFVKQLGNTVIAYAEGGVHQMYPAGSTFGHRTLLPSALVDESCVAGNKFEHIFLTAAGELYKLKPEGEPVLLGYKQYLGDTPLSMEYNSNLKECYIKYAALTYVLDKYGLYSMDATQAEVRLETEWLNFSAAGLKQLSEVMLGITAGTSVKVYLKVGDNTSNEIPINSVNCVKPFITGDKFKIGISAAYATFELDEINLQTINVDGRFGQGVSL